jgi:hypothetical protein
MPHPSINKRRTPTRCDSQPGPWKFLAFGLAFMSYSIAAAGRNSSEITAPSTLQSRAWWAAESERVGTNWRSLIELHLKICDRLQASSSWARSS